MVIEIWLDLLLALLGFSLLICFIRLYLGPNPPNRTVAFDTIAIHAVAIIALFSMRSNAPVLLDAAVVTAVLGFVGTMMLARYMEQSNLQDWEPDED
ncbi:MAG: cation transporter [Caldilineaceae bacterium]|nr:cation transporter [Caldilineaceae bacterium]